ncbi:MAG: hypothetical protein ACKVRN_02980 [Pyrinomonadaceae bacterium]
MSNQVIHTGGEDVVVREDTAKAFRGVNWALLSIAAFLIIMAIMFFAFFWATAKDGTIESPSQIESQRAP